MGSSASANRPRNQPASRTSSANSNLPKIASDAAIKGSESQDNDKKPELGDRSSSEPHLRRSNTFSDYKPEHPLDALIHGDTVSISKPKPLQPDTRRKTRNRHPWDTEIEWEPSGVDDQLAPLGPNPKLDKFYSKTRSKNVAVFAIGDDKLDIDDLHNNPQHWWKMWGSNPRMSMSFTASKGLLNAPGANNCFLNSAVQVLWHLDVFRRNFRQLTGHYCMGNSCIFCAVKVIFTQFQYSDQAALPPDALRKALAKTFQDQHRFQMNLMDDAAECFENILTRIHFHLTNNQNDEKCTALHCVPHQMFSQAVVEQIVCKCGAKSREHAFSQMVQYVSTNALCNEAKNMRASLGSSIPDADYGYLLKQAFSQGNDRSCPSSSKKCGARVAIHRKLTNNPDVLSLGLIWDSDQPSSKQISEVVQAIGTRLKLKDLFDSCSPQAGREELQLVGVVCYYGKHYSTFFLHSKRNAWISFDDATVKEMGQWSQVADKCCRGHYQPLLLLYANPRSREVNTKTAPSSTSMVPGYSFSNDPRGKSPEQAQPPANQNQNNVNHSRQGSAGSDRALRPGGQNPHNITPQISNVPSGEKPSLGRSESARARTPNPDEMLRSASGDLITNANYPERRSITPGPEWGRYDSDDEESKAAKTKTGSAHFRQSSYLTAMEELSRNMENKGQNQAVTNMDNNYNSAYNAGANGYNTSHGNQGYDVIDGSRYPQSGYNNQTYAPSNGYQQGYSNTQGYEQPPYNSSYQQQGTYPHQSYPQQGYSNQIGYTNHYGQNNPQSSAQAYANDPRSQNYNRSTSQPFSETSRSSVASSSSSNSYHIPPATASQYPAQQQTRPQSASTNQANSQHIPAHYEATNSSRPASAQHGQNIGQYNVKQQNQMAASRNQAAGKTTDSKNNSSSQKWGSEWTEEDNYGTYINSKAVERVLGNHLKTARPRTGNPNYAQLEIPVKSNYGIDTDSQKESGYRSGGSSVERSSSSSNDTHAQYGINQHAQSRYPTQQQQTMSSQSQQQNSSKTPVNQSSHLTHSNQAPSQSNQRHNNYAPFTAPSSQQNRTVAKSTGLTYDKKSFASTESLSAGVHKSGHVLKSGQHHLHHQGAGLSPSRDNHVTSAPHHGYAMSGTRVISKSEESLAVIEDNTKPVKDLVKQLSNKLPVGPNSNQQTSTSSKPHATNSTTAAKPKPPTPQRTTSTLSSNQTQKQGVPSNHGAHGNKGGNQGSQKGMSVAPTDTLYVQAEGLLELSSRKEDQGDYHTALAHCNQAIGCLQQLLSQASTNPETLVHVRLQHNAAVLKSRALHHKIQSPSRQCSSNSNLSSDDQSSLSSMSTDGGEQRHSKASKHPYNQQHSSNSTKQLPSQPNKPAPELPTKHSSATTKSSDFLKPMSQAPTRMREDFPEMPQRRKFMSDYVSREDYFNHHPPPPNYGANLSGAQKSSSKPVSEEFPPPPPDFLIPVPKPNLPPKPSVKNKPKLKHSMSTDKSVKSYPEMDESGSINIYATLPRRPKNRERSSTLASQHQAEVYQAYLNSQKQHKDTPDQVDGYNSGYPQQQQNHGAYSVNTGPSQEQYNSAGAHGHMTQHHVTNSPSRMNQSQATRRSSRDDVINGSPAHDYIQTRGVVNTGNEQDLHNLSIESMVTQQINQLTLTRDQSNRSTSQSQQQQHHHHVMSSSQGQGHHSGSRSSSGGPLIQRVMPQQNVPVSSSQQLPVYPHPPMYQGNGRQVSVESHTSSSVTPSSGSTHNTSTSTSTLDQQHNSSRLEAHQMALMHATHQHDIPLGKFPPKHDLRKSASSSQISQNASPKSAKPVVSNPKSPKISKKSSKNGDSNKRGANERPVLSTFSAPVTTKAPSNDQNTALQLDLQVNDKPGVELINSQSNRSLHSKNSLQPPSLHISSSNGHLDVTDSHSNPSLSKLGRHRDSLDTLVNDDSYITSCYIDGCEYVVEKKSNPLPSDVTMADIVETKTSDSDLADFCVLEHGSVKKSGMKPLKVPKEPSDCSSSSGIEVNTQSDTSSYTSRGSKPTKSVLVKKKKAIKSRKNVTFSDKVILVAKAPQEQEHEQTPPDYIAYVQALLKRSPRKIMDGDADNANDGDIGPSDVISGTTQASRAPRCSTPGITEDALGKVSGYDSDFDEETDDSCASDDVTGDKVLCNLCRKKLIDVNNVFCRDCSHYMSNLAPATSHV